QAVDVAAHVLIVVVVIKVYAGRRRCNIRLRRYAWAAKMLPGKTDADRRPGQFCRGPPGDLTLSESRHAAHRSFARSLRAHRRRSFSRRVDFTRRRRTDRGRPFPVRPGIKAERDP